jgi:hypothetical protein
VINKKLLIINGAVIIGLIAAFYFYTPTQSTEGLSEETCEKIDREIKDAVGYNSKISNAKELADIFSKVCHNNKIKKPQVVVKVKTLPKETCVAIEESLLPRTTGANEYAEGSYSKIERANTYIDLSERGCAENRDKFRKLAVREIEIGRALIYEIKDKYTIARFVNIYQRLGMTQEAESIIDEFRKANLSEDEIRKRLEQ